MLVEYAFYGLVGVALLLALTNWRAALYVCIFVDILRDPVRKLAEGHSVWITQSVNLVWVAVGLAVLLGEQRRMAQFGAHHPRMKTAATLLCVALIPGAVMSLTQYAAGWKLVLLGSASYLAVIPGIVAGYAFARSERDVTRFLAVYCVANSVAFVGTLLEYADFSSPVLGGIDMDWIRYRTGHIVELMSGVYRSPDLLGLHAANVCVFACVLGARRRGAAQLAWYSVALWAVVSLMLSGRRKMIAVPLVFAASFLFLYFRKVRRVSHAAWYTLPAAACLAAVFLFSSETSESDEYTEYASTVFGDEGVERAYWSVVGSPTTTLQQSGVLGKGLGSATQGSYHLAARDRPRTWQEDGTGRLFVELGLLGGILAMVAAWLVVRSCYEASGRSNFSLAAARFQAGMFSVVVANAASFIVSHQAYSGDPSSVCFVLLCLGFAFRVSAHGMPRHTGRYTAVPVGHPPVPHPHARVGRRPGPRPMGT